jgi:ribonucleoside-diphosphate reductase alpha chain
MWLGAEGGGRGVGWSDVRPSGSPIKGTDSTSSGVIPFLGPSDRLTYSISQAGVRRSTEAAYLRVDHPDIKHFIEIRLETGDKNRRMPNLHQGIVLTDKFMKAVKNLEPWDLIDPSTGKVMDTVDAFDLWIDILLIRKTETGEPFLLFIDTVNANKPAEYKLLNIDVTNSNICTEIMLYTDPDTTAVCCLASVNLEYWDEWKNLASQIIADVSDLLDAVLDTFLRMTSGVEEKINKFLESGIGESEIMELLSFQRARRSVISSRDIGIGTMGLHSLYQKRRLPFESPMAKALNNEIFSTLRKLSDEYQASLPKDSICPMSESVGTHRRNIHTLAVAPTMSISNLCNVTSSGIEPWLANSFTQKVLQGSFIVRNKYLNTIIVEEALKLYPDNEAARTNWASAQWKLVDKARGSAQTLEWLSDWDKDVFKTAFEINPLSVISQAGDRAPYIDQGQSLNLFIPAEVSYEELHTIHYLAWEVGVKSLYYLRSESEVSADTGSRERKPITLEADACVACT